jgi:DNA repair protein RadA/Sms
MRSRPWSEIVHEQLEPRPWLWEGYIARGAVTALSAAPKAGKTTLTSDLMRAFGTGRREFLGARIESCPVLVVSEESRHEWQERGAGLDLGDVHVIPREELVGAPPWEHLLPELGDEAEALGCGLVVLDTFRKLAKLPENGENDAGTVQRALEPCIELAARELGVLVLHHNRKGGGEHGEGASGSTAFVGALDALLTMTRHGDDSHRRRLEVISRWPAPEELVVERRAEGYVALGTRGEVSAGDRGQRVAALAEEVLAGMVADGAPAKLRDLEDRHEEHRKLVRDALAMLEDRGEVTKTGRGVRGDPFVFVPALGIGTNRIESAPADEPLEGWGELSSFLDRELEL